MFDHVYCGDLDSWATIWLFTGWLNDMYTILPQINMSQNIGWNEKSTHTHDSENWTASLQALEIYFPLIHPSSVKRNVSADKWSDIHLWHIRRLQPLIHILSRSKLLRLLYHHLFKRFLLRTPDQRP